MRDRFKEFGPETSLALVTFSQVADLGDYAERNQIPFPILIDEDREFYHRYGLKRAATSRIYSWRSVRAYWELFDRDGFSKISRPTEDTLQLGGDFVIGKNGDLLHGFWSEGPGDRPSIDTLISAAKS